MDQIKPIIDNLVKHRFWVGCGLMVVTTLVVAYLATSNVSKKREELVTDIKGKFTSTNNLSGVDPADGLSNLSDESKAQSITAFPNQKTLDQMDVITDQAKLAARQAWDIQYNQQRKLLVFPEDLPAEVRAAFRRFLPIETKLPKFDEIKPQEEAREEYRMAYGGYIKARLPQLAKKIGAKWQPGASAAGASGMMSGGMMSGSGMMGSRMFGGGSGGSSAANPMGNSGGSSGAVSSDPEFQDDGTPEVVQWSPGNQSTWLMRATEFQGKNGNTSPNNIPTTHQVMYLQEELWVLEAVFDVIKKTNGDADANDLAAIKTIDHILVGRSAGSVGQMSSLDAVGSASGAGMYGDMSEMMKMMSQQMSGGASANRNQPQVAESDDPAHMRYVDKDFELIEAGEFHKDLNATSPDKAYLQVAKRIPVRLGFQMKETAILKLLGECANSDPPIEVRQVRLNRHTAESGGMFSSSSKATTGITEQSMSKGQNVGAAGGGANEDVEQDTATDVIGVEIYGVVYIYNPVPDQADPDNVLKLVKPEQANNQTAMRSPSAPVPSDG